MNLDISLPIYPVSDTNIILSTFISRTAETAAYATDSAVPYGAGLYNFKSLNYFLKSIVFSASTQHLARIETALIG